MSTTLTPDFVIIGAGAGGLSVAAVASQLDFDVVLIERGKMGGDCLNYGCVPSKALLAASHHAQAIASAQHFGITAENVAINFKKVHQHVQEVIATIEPHDSEDRFRKLGVNVIRGEGRFIDAKTVQVGTQHIKARYTVIATGSSPAIPNISGLADIPYYTNETIFSLAQCPEHLLIIGGGPIGIEMAQAFVHLGAQVSLVTRSEILPKDDRDMTALLKAELQAQGIKILEHVTTNNIRQAHKTIKLDYTQHDEQHTLTASHCLCATGRQANHANLNLAAAGIKHNAHGIEIDKRCRTSVKKIFAIGDVASPYQFTHVAGYQAGLVIKNALFKIPAKANYRALPWVTYTSPELAQVGLTEQQAIEQQIRHTVICEAFASADRAQAEHCLIGRIKIILDHKGKVIGATILGKGAGELIIPWGLLISQKQGLKALSDLIVPYPSFSDLHKKVISKYYTPLLYSNNTKRLVHFLKIFG